MYIYDCTFPYLTKQCNSNTNRNETPESHSGFTHNPTHYVNYQTSLCVTTNTVLVIKSTKKTRLKANKKKIEVNLNVNSRFRECFTY